MKNSTAFWVIYTGFVAVIIYMGYRAGTFDGFGTGEFVILYAWWS